jgi:hypothetical protein
MKMDRNIPNGMGLDRNAISMSESIHQIKNSQGNSRNLHKDR